MGDLQDKLPKNMPIITRKFYSHRKSMIETTTDRNDLTSTINNDKSIDQI